MYKIFIIGTGFKSNLIPLFSDHETIIINQKDTGLSGAVLDKSPGRDLGGSRNGSQSAINYVDTGICASASARLGARVFGTSATTASGPVVIDIHFFTVDHLSYSKEFLTSLDQIQPDRSNPEDNMDQHTRNSNAGPLVQRNITIHSSLSSSESSRSLTYNDDLTSVWSCDRSGLGFYDTVKYCLTTAYKNSNVTITNLDLNSYFLERQFIITSFQFNSIFPTLATIPQLSIPETVQPSQAAQAAQPNRHILDFSNSIYEIIQNLR